MPSAGTSHGTRLLSWTLSLLLLLSLCPTAALAAEPEPLQESTVLTDTATAGDDADTEAETHAGSGNTRQAPPVEGEGEAWDDADTEAETNAGNDDTRQASPVESEGEAWDDADTEAEANAKSGDTQQAPPISAQETVTVFQTDVVTASEESTYVWMNIPYGEFYAAEKGSSETAATIDAVSSATKSKPKNANLAANSYHVSSDGSDITGITYPVKVQASALTSLTKAASKDALFSSASYAYYDYSGTPASYKELTIAGSTKTFGKATGAATADTDATATFITNDRHADYAIQVAGLDGVETGATNVCGVTLHTTDNNVYGLRHVSEIWRGTELGFNRYKSQGKTDQTPYAALVGKTIDQITYYLNDGAIRTIDLSNASILVPPKADVTVEVESVDVGTSSTTFTMTGTLPTDFDPSYSVTLEGASVQPDANNTGGTITFPAGAPFGSYTLRITDQKGVYAPVEASFSLYGYVLMNIPYSEFYAGEVDKGDTLAEIDAVSSATRNKPRTGTLAANSYHTKADGSDIAGVIYPVQISNASLLEGYTEVTDSDRIDITVTNRGQTTTTTYEGKDALFERPDHAYYVLSEKPSYYKKLSSRHGSKSFAKATGTAATWEGVTVGLTTGARHAYYEASLEGIPDEDIATKVCGVTLHTTDSHVYGLRHVSEIWRGTELGFSDDGFYAGLQGRTIDKITYYLNDGTIATITTSTKVPKSSAGVKLEVADATLTDSSVTSTSMTVSGLPTDFTAVYKVFQGDKDVTSSFTVNSSSGTISWTDPSTINGVYTLTVSDSSGAYAPVSTDFELLDPNIYVQYDKASQKLVKRNDSVPDAQLTKFLAAISSVKVDETNYTAAGQRGVVIVKPDGSIDLTASPFAAGDNIYDIVVKADGYAEVSFQLTTGTVSGSGVLPKVAGDNGTTYIGLFKPCVFQPEYNQLWHDYTAAVVGESAADEMAELLKQMVSGDKYGQAAIQAHTSQYCCELIHGADTIAFEGNTITVKNQAGTVLSTGTYTYIGQATVGTGAMSFPCDVYQKDTAAVDADAPDEFRYFLLRDDNPADTYHIEFRYGSDIGQLKGYTTDNYAYWLAAGIPQNHDATMVENAIALFCLENLTEMADPAERSAESLAQIAALTGTWDCVSGTPAYLASSFTIHADGTSGDGAAYAFGNKYALHSDAEIVWAQYSLSGDTLILTETMNGTPSAVVYQKRRSSSDGSSSGGSSGGSHHAHSSGASGGGSSSGSTAGGSSSGSKPSATTETTTDPTTGAVVTTTQDNASGKHSVHVKLPADTVAAAQQDKAALVLPIAKVVAAKETTKAPVITVETGSETPVKMEIPLEQVTPGTVAVLVHPDGTEEIIKTSVPTETGLALRLADNSSIKIIDNSKAFVDTQNHWAADAIHFVSAREIFSGTSADQFSPDVPLTRAMLMTVLARYDGTDTSGGSVWYEAGMQWSIDNGISDGSNPDKEITREQMVTMLYRYAGSPETTATLAAFSDSSAVSDYAATAMAWAVDVGLITGMGNSTIAPKGNATRAQVATVLTRFCTQNAL